MRDVRGPRLPYIIGTGGPKGKTGGHPRARATHGRSERDLQLEAPGAGGAYPAFAAAAGPGRDHYRPFQAVRLDGDIDLDMRGDEVTGYGQTVKACLLGQAASAIVGAHIIGANAAELRETAAAMRRMLKENGPPPKGRFAELDDPRAGAPLQGAAWFGDAGVRRHRARHRRDRGQARRRAADAASA